MNKSKIEWTERTWNPVPNFEGYYASADGCILSKRSHQPRIMNPMKQKDGYLYVYLYDGYGNQKKMYVHRLVLMSWVGMPKDGQECRHLNDDPSDNRIENLLWGTRIENVADKRRNHGLQIGERSSSHKLTEGQVMEIRQRYSDGKSARELSAEYGVSHNAILKIARGSSWKHLPIITVNVKHSSRRITPMSEREREVARINMRKAIDARKSKRIYTSVLCACGCGNYLTTPDNRGRERRFIQRHYNWWRYKENNQNNSKNEQNKN